MSPSSSRDNWRLSVLGLLLLLWGCGESEPNTNLGNWTLSTNELTLNKALQVNETENYFFGSIQDLDVASDGRIVVADQEASQIKVLRPNGTLIDTLGRQGEAPGEFQHLWKVQIVSGDSIYVHDYEAARITVFGASAPFPVTRTISLPRSPRPAGGSLEGVFPGNFWVVQSNLIVEYHDRLTLADATPPHRTVGRMGQSDILKDTLLRGPYPASKRVSIDGVVNFKDIPYARDTEVALGPDGRLYSGYEDRLRITAHAMDGTSKIVADVPAPPVSIPESERDSLLESMEPEVRQVMASAMPETKPAFTDLVVADDGRLWMKRPTKGPDAKTVPWWVLDPETKTIQELHVPAAVDLRVVQDGYAYGSTTTDTGAPAVVRYRIRPET